MAGFCRQFITFTANYYIHCKFTLMRKKGLLLTVVILIVLVGLYFAGPSPSTPVYNKDMPALPSDPAGLDAYVRNNEAQHKLKPDNEARIVWAAPAGHNGSPSPSADSLTMPDLQAVAEPSFNEPIR